MTKFIILLSLIFFSACIYMPSETTKVQESRPSLTFLGGDKKAEIYVNNVRIGAVGDFQQEDRKAVFIEEGVVQVKLVLEEKVIWQEKMFVSGDQVKVINLK